MPTSNVLPSPAQLISAKLPDWIASTTAQERAHMRAAVGERPGAFEAACLAHPHIARQLSQQYAAQRQAEQALRALLGRLPDLHQYASERLQDAVQQRFNVTLDVARTYLLNPGKAAAYKLQLDGDPLADGQRALILATQSLLHCALQNFEAAEAKPGGMDVPGIPALVLDSDRYVFVVPQGNTLPIAADAFAALVRELDIGGAYQAQIDALLGAPNEDQSPARKIFLDAERSAFRLHVHKALLDQSIDPGLHSALLLLADEQPAQYLDSPLRCALLEVFGVELTGALVIGLVPSPEQLLSYDPLLLPYKQMLVTYLPGAPAPLRVHATAPQLQAWLQQQLANCPQAHRSAWVAQHDQARFERKLAEGDGGGTARLRSFSGSWADRLAAQRQQRLRDDALYHAVPTAQEDRKTASKRLAYFAQLGFAALNVGAFFVPGLNTLMLGLTVVQLGVEVFEGIESWADGDREQALGYLVDVLENLALAGALGATASPGQVPAVEVPGVVDALVPVELPDGNPRLWQPDLRPFAHDTVLPAGLEADAQGLYQHDGKTWLPLDGSLYALTPGPAYRLLHPGKGYGYQPPLRHNGAGAWLHPLDQPHTWRGVRLLRRFRPAGAVPDDSLAAQILQAAGVEDSVLRRALNQGERLPAQLQDTLLRFTLDQQVRQALPGASRIVRMAAFDRRLARQPANPTPAAALLRRVYPGLPEAVIDELLHNARPDASKALATGRIPLRMGEELRQYQQGIRLARAYEGLYLDCVANADSDRLLLHTARQLPEWPSDLRVELHDSTQQPGLVDSIGPATAARHRLIRRYPNGYAVSTLYPAPGAAPLHDTLYEALHDAIGGSGDSSLAVLRQRIQDTALPRNALRTLLGMQRRAFVSPMRLADGRLGYPLSPSPSPTPSPKPLLHDLGRLDQINRHLRQLEAMGIQPAIANWLLSVMAELPISHAQISERIAALPAASAVELETSLTQWRGAPGAIVDEQMRSYSRDMIETALWRHWVLSALAEPNELPLALYFNNTFIAEFPQHLPASFTSQVRHLHLDDVWLDHALPQPLPRGQIEAQIDNLLQHFSNLETLVIDRRYAYNSAPSPWQHALARLTGHLPQLSELRFVNQNVTLTLQEISRLAQPPRLRYLDLSGNSLAAAPAQAGTWTLGYLGLERMSLTQWPAWLDEHALERIDSVSLLHNHLAGVPEFLALNPVSDAPPTVVSLEGNPLPEQQVTYLALSEDSLTRRYRFNLTVNSGLGQRLRTLFNQREELSEALDQWVNAGLDGQAQATRRVVVSELYGFWGARARGQALSPLHFLNLPLEHFPDSLPDFLTHQVEQLIVEGLHGSTAQLDSLLRQFPRLITVALYENTDSLQALPAALETLAGLNELELVNQGLLIDDEVLSRLVRLPALESLDLSENRLSPTLRGPFPGARQLAHLSLSGTGLETWPDWLFEVMPSVTLDLGYNRLSRLPDNVLGVALVDTPSTRVSLAENPLDADIRQRLDDQDGELTLRLPHGYRPGQP